MKEIGISGGTFNPVHTWHLVAAQCAIEQYGLDKVLLIPNGDPPHKKAGVLDKEERWEMVVAAAATMPGKLEASRIELDRQGPSYTLDTLTALKAQYGEGVRLNLIIGLDNLEPIPRWYKADEIFKLVRLLIAPRLNIPQAEIDRLVQNLPAGADYAFIEAPTSNVSSTLVRDWIARGKSVQYLVPPAVHSILTAKGHYRTPPAPAATPAPAPVAATPAPTATPAPDSPSPRAPAVALIPKPRPDARSRISATRFINRRQNHENPHLQHHRWQHGLQRPLPLLRGRNDPRQRHRLQAARGQLAQLPQGLPARARQRLHHRHDHEQG
jgi:nicotinate-nucleotide adenylyltransferase